MTSAASEDGFSLVEVLLSVAIMGICFAGLLGGMGMSVLASDVHRSQADGHALLVSAGEAVKDEARNAYTCPTPSTFSFTAVPLPGGWSAAALDVALVENGYWDGSTFVVTADCAAVDLQRVTLRATSPDGRAVEELTVVKRRPS